MGDASPSPRAKAPQAATSRTTHMSEASPPDAETRRNAHTSLVLNPTRLLTTFPKLLFELIAPVWCAGSRVSHQIKQGPRRPRVVSNPTITSAHTNLAICLVRADRLARHRSRKAPRAAEPYTWVRPWWLRLAWNAVELVQSVARLARLMPPRTHPESGRNESARSGLGFPTRGMPSGDGMSVLGSAAAIRTPHWVASVPFQRGWSHGAACLREARAMRASARMIRGANCPRGRTQRPPPHTDTTVFTETPSPAYTHPGCSCAACDHGPSEQGISVTLSAPRQEVPAWSVSGGRGTRLRDARLSGTLSSFARNGCTYPLDGMAHPTASEVCTHG